MVEGYSVSTARRLVRLCRCANDAIRFAQIWSRAVKPFLSDPLPGSVEFTPEELRGAASMTPLEVDVLSAAGNSSRIRQARSPGGWAFDTSYLNGHVRARGAFAPGYMAVLAVMQGGDATICGVPLDDGVVMIIPDGMEIAASIRPGVVYSAAVLPVGMWSDIVVTEAGEGALSTLPLAVRQPPGRAEPLAAQLAATLRCFDPASPYELADGMPAPFADFLGGAAGALAGTESLDRHLDRSLRRRLRQAWRAEDFIHANLSMPLAIPHICREVGVSRRQLEYAFHTTFGVGPSEYIRLARLNESRRQLRSARARGRTVTDVAMDAGVTHLGRFAESYRMLFGETPHQTLRGTC